MTLHKCEIPRRLHKVLNFRMKWNLIRNRSKCIFHLASHRSKYFHVFLVSSLFSARFKSSFQIKKRAWVINYVKLGEELISSATEKTSKQNFPCEALCVCKFYAILCFLKSFERNFVWRVFPELSKLFWFSRMILI